MRTTRLIAIVTGIVGFLAALSIPFLPVQQDAASISWPQADLTESVNAPLVSYTPERIRVHAPCAAIAALGPDGGTVVSTMPEGASDRFDKGLVIRSDADGAVDVILRGTTLTSLTAQEAAACGDISVSSDAEATTTTVSGLDRTETVGGDLRPRMVGLYTDLDQSVPGLNVHVDLDSRFSSSPTLLKLLAMIVCVLATISSLVALHRLDGVDHRRARRFLPAHWWKFTGVDVVVIGTLLLWHVIGANTSDDGYLLSMARVSEHSGYMANYYRWFGVPEAPFGWYYEVLAAFAKISTASMWMRLPALIAGIACWMVISREVVPRLGVAVRRNRVALWTGGLVFLAFWLPYDNGLRPEPVIALGALLTWCSIERAIATGRMLPAAVAVLIAAFSLAAGPSGLICVAALVAGSRPVVKALVARRRNVGVAAQAAPMLAAGTVVLVAVFADQTLATVLESTRVRNAVGPSLAWFEERMRWDALMTISPDGSLARRFGVFVMLLCLVLCVMLILRKGRIPGTAIGPSRRILGIVFASLLLMMFTPTKWTHHFGVYAGLAGSVAVLAAVGVGAASIRSKRNRSLFAAGVLFVLALSFTGSNGWWYVSSYGIPWFDKPPSIAGRGFSTGFLALTVLALLLAAWFHFREPYEKGRPNGSHARALAVSPLTLAAIVVVVFEVASLAKGFVSQYPAYSVGKANLDSITGTCALADAVLVENDPNAAVLPLRVPPVDLAGAGAFGATESTGFTPDGVADDLTADTEERASGAANTVDSDESATTGTSAGTGGGSEATEGINGSTVSLPFGLDRGAVPVLGSYQPGEQGPAALTTGWYALPERTDDAPLLTIAAAGRIRSVDRDGIVTPGGSLQVEYGRTAADGSTEILGTVDPIDIGPAPSWRNLRVPLDAIAAEADSVRLVVTDEDASPDQWLAVTPPRVPVTQTLQNVVGSDAPVLLDWSVGLAFPCQRPFDHRYGVAEVPEYRILPDRTGAEATNAWQDHFGGGPLGWTTQLLRAETYATYLDEDWYRDWGSLERYTPIDPSAGTPQIDVEQVDRWGTWTPGPVRIG
ncbi:arabinosyltransferase [Rhodococcus triatomae]|uniref:Arabinosyltransferase C n=1 Tax=Rhodococcus triatomae TaxID=300028 RepID=A0A1G8I020_9NOCA|nr:arabinosyltransferase [Rhodococcus triatomae]QNG25643.1 arabinosyltransferase [Rhodococcus triatomae]SDI12258.1 arabinosyltransferase C [Rhodococcus triatomae]